MTSATAPSIDVQGSADGRRLAIDQVGIKDLRHPITLLNRDGRVQHTVGRFNMFVELPHDRRGTHMSRFVELLHAHEEPLDVAALKTLVQRVAIALDSANAEVAVNFSYFVAKRAPVSGIQSLLDYDVTLTGRQAGPLNRVLVRLVVPVTSLCPCSKQISAYGAHNQRSHVTVQAFLEGPLWIEDLIDIVEQEASCDIYGLIKRSDEKFVTERAYDNPKFVEDLVRDIAARLNADPRVGAYTVACENFESIHNHSAYALIREDKETGLPP